MDFPRFIMPWLAAIAACLLVSCIDGHEEVWMESNGSGRAEIAYSLPASAARFQGGAAGVHRMIGKFLAANPGISSFSHEVISVDDRLTVRVHVQFDSIFALQKMTAAGAIQALPSSASHLAGRTEMKIDGRTVEFKRTISPGLALPGAGFMPASMFEGRNLVYTIHLPMAPASSNATRTDDLGRTLIWEIPLTQAVQAPISTQFVAKIPIPRWLVGVALSLVGLASYGVIRRFQKLGKMRTSVAEEAAD
jgi:hypothetical protein